MKGLPERIQELRENLDLGQKELAALLGVSRSTVASWESGHRKPELSYVEALAKLGKVSVDWLLGRTDDPYGQAIPPHSDTPPSANAARAAGRDESALDKALLQLQHEERLTEEEVAALREHILSGLKLLRANKKRAD